MKKSEKKIISGKHRGKVSGAKKKRKRKLVLKDGIQAALIAALFIGVAALVSVSILTANSVIHGTPEKAAGTANSSPEKETREPEAPPAEHPPEEKVVVTEKPKEPVKISELLPKDEPVSKTEPEVPVSPVKTIPAHKGTITIVMDDAGNNLRELEPFLSFPGPMTIAVLPGLPYSAEAARRIRAAGKELILHQPMEAIGGQNPGPGAIYTNMSDAEIRSVLEKNLAEVGPVAGMNNHQGSKVTMDKRVMEIILSVCHDQRIYFLDSRTTADTAAPLIAGRRGIRIWERDVFLDNIQEKAAMIRSFHEGLQKAEKKGGAVMIGHVWSSELAAVLEELYPEMVEQGYSLSTISKVMMGTFDHDDSWD